MADMEVRYVEWLDSSTRNGWHFAGEIQKHDIDRCCSVGFVLREDAECLVLIQSYTNRVQLENQYGDATAIPKLVITHQRTLRKAKP